MLAVRNFWVESQVDGRRTPIKGGPARKDGGLDLQLFQREDGAITQPIEIQCKEEDQRLITKVYIDGSLVANHITNR